MRFNPNLYQNGKVCLSLLGTWTGQGAECWNASNSTFLQVVISIQSLIFVAKPFFNEPGYMNQEGTATGERASREYNEALKPSTIRWAISAMLEKPPEHFEEVWR